MKTAAGLFEDAQAWFNRTDLTSVVYLKAGKSELALHLSQDKLVDTERVQQSDLTRSLAQEIQFFESNLTENFTIDVARALESILKF